jgi:hypothetical protein
MGRRAGRRGEQKARREWRWTTGGRRAFRVRIAAVVATLVPLTVEVPDHDPQLRVFVAAPRSPGLALRQKPTRKATSASDRAADDAGEFARPGWGGCFGRGGEAWPDRDPAIGMRAAAG